MPPSPPFNFVNLSQILEVLVFMANNWYAKKNRSTVYSQMQFMYTVLMYTVSSNSIAEQLFSSSFFMYM